ncbi:MAG: hypothetical protein QOG20_2320 [Pseudonocardiales bacterium]|jgi:GntR family transcriptional repressor for pyruvate dehydrogenase complex|nr:hypothetical protein [Pseudonocardiales bacterium]
MCAKLWSVGAQPSDEPPARASFGPVGHKLRVPKMAELIANHLRSQIVRGELREGDALPPESALLKQFDVSRPTLREALRVLESESLITVRRGANGGARVQVPSAKVAARRAAFILEHRSTTLRDVYEARIVIEPASVALLAELRSDETMECLRHALAAHDATADDPVRLIHTHVAFHSVLVELTGNQTLILLMSMLGHIIDLANLARVESTVGTPAHERASRKGLAAHHRVVEFIEAGDADGAERLWRTHLTEARDYLVRADVETVLDLMG